MEDRIAQLQEDKKGLNTNVIELQQSYNRVVKDGEVLKG